MMLIRSPSYRQMDAELINFESSAGFNHLPTEIIQRFDALQDLVESIEASSVNDNSEAIGYSAIDHRNRTRKVSKGVR